MLNISDLPAFLCNLISMEQALVIKGFPDCIELLSEFSINMCRAHLLIFQSLTLIAKHEKFDSKMEKQL